MPTININNTTAFNISHETTETLSRLATSLLALKNTDDRLLLGSNQLATDDTWSETHRIESSSACLYFKSGCAAISVKHALVAVNKVLSERDTKPYQDTRSVYASQLAAQGLSFSSPAQSKIDSDITALYFYTTGQIPPPEDRIQFVELSTGLSILRQLGLSAITPNSSSEKNGTAQENRSELLRSLHKTIKSSGNIKSLYIKPLLNIITTNIPLDQLSSRTVYEDLPQNTKSILLKSVCFVGANLKLPELKEIHLGGISIGQGQENAWETQHSLEFNEVDFPLATFNCVDIEGSHFSKANLTGIALKNVKSADTDFTSATLSGALFRQVDFSHSNFFGADLTDISCERVNFTGADLTGAKISLSAQFLDRIFDNEVDMDDHINHLNNENQGLLVSINSIDSKYETQRNALMRSVIERLSQLDDGKLASSWDSLANILLMEPSYLKDPVIAGFVHSRLLPQWMASKSQGLLRADEINLAVVLDQLNASASTIDWSASKYQGAVNQLLCAATLVPNKADLQQSAEQLQTTYLNNSAIRNAALALDRFGGEGLSRETYIFSSINGQQVMALDPELFKALVSTTPETIPWNNFYFLKRESQTEPFTVGNIDDTSDLKSMYAIQPFLQARIAGLMQSETARSLVGIILGDSLHSAAFVEAFSRNTVQNKLLAPTQQDELYDTFAPHWQVAEGDVHDPQNTSRHLRPEHQEQLWQTVNGLGLEDTAHNRAAVMLCLSSMFTRYSSSALFGTETESPPAVRLYASALLNEARLLDPALIDQRTAIDWQARLLGIGSAFTCTAILNSMMNEYMKDKTAPNSPLEQVSLGLYPAAWR